MSERHRFNKKKNPTIIYLLLRTIVGDVQAQLLEMTKYLGLVSLNPVKKAQLVFARRGNNERRRFVDMIIFLLPLQKESCKFERKKWRRMEVREFIRKEVSDWEDEEVGRARFKAFSGQRSDWDPTYRFWNHLILSIAKHFRLLIISPSQVLLL